MAAVKSKKKSHSVRSFLLTFFISLFALCGVGAVYFIVVQESFDFTIVGDWFQGNQTVSQSAPVQNYGLVLEGKEVDASYFDDAVFLGDSLTRGMLLQPYRGNATVLGVDGIHIEQVLNNKAYELPNGQMAKAVDAVTARNPKKIYIMLGTNGVGYLDFDEMINDYKRLINLLKAKNPNAIFYIQSIPPATQSHIKSSNMSVKKIRQYNEKLLQLAEESECYYLDTYSQFVTESGYLPRSLSSDNTVHLNDDGYEVMFQYLRTHTVQAKN